MKSIFIKPLKEEEIVSKIKASPKKGAWRFVVWNHDTFDYAGHEIVTTYGKWCRFIDYNKMKSVIERKAAEDEKIGAPKDRKKSVYTHFKDEEGNLVDKIEAIVRLAKDPTEDKKYLQMMYANKHTIKWEAGKKLIIPEPTEVKYYMDGIEIKDNALLKVIKAAHPEKTKTHTGLIETWVVKLENIIDIK